MKYNRKPIQEHELVILHYLYPNHEAQLFARLFNRSLSSIYGMANSHGIRKDPKFASEITRRKWEAGVHTNSRKNHFKKGQEPWNKGMKGLNLGGTETQFKKGDLPYNTKYDGCISTRGGIKNRNGRWVNETYLYIRISKAKWVPLHRHVWQQHKGPIPKGYVVAFKDRNYKNCNITNLELISMKENMERNTIHNYPDDLKRVIRAKAKLNKTINKVMNSKN